MGENLDVEGRLSVRTPMQWSDERNAGFSTAAPSRLPRPITEGEYGPLAVNVAAQRRDPDSLLSWMERAIRRRRETPEFGWGECTILDTSDRAILAHRLDWAERKVVAVHNFSAEPLMVEIEVGSEPDVTLEDLLDHSANPIVGAGQRLELKIEGYGFRWFRVLEPGERIVP